MSAMELGSFGDERLRKVGRDFMAAVAALRTVCLRKLGGNRRGEMRFGRFLHNDAVTVREMIETAACAAGLSAAGRHVLAIQDTSEINFEAHVRSKEGFGTVGNGTDIGLFLHPLIAVDAEHGGIIGLAGAEIMNRTGGKVTDRKARALEDKESQRWLNGLNTAANVLHGADMVTVIADRESDVYGLFAERGERTHLLVRAAQNRALDDGGKLFETVRHWPVRGDYVIDVPVKPGQIARKATVSLRFGVVTIKRPKGSPRSWAESLELTVVDVMEESPPEGATPVHWLLLTSHSVTTLAEACQIVAWYRLRWIIEQIFRTLKSQCLNIEQSQILTVEPMSKLLIIALIAAVSVMQLIHARDGRSRQRLKDSVINFDPRFLIVLCALLEGKTLKQKNPHAPDSLAWLSWIAGRLGGWSGYTSKGYKPAGPKTMHDGLIQLEARYQGWRITNGDG